MVRIKPPKPIDKVRASRAGHEFHENWAARKSLELLLGTSGLSGVAVEGFAPEDQGRLSQDAVDIADVTLYYGGVPSFETARETVVVQLKYSHAHLHVPVRAAESKKTIKKFAAAFRDHAKHFGAHAVDRRLSFELVTNRPIHAGFIEAVAALAEARKATGDARTQANQVVSASGLSGADLRRFAAKVRLTGLAGTLAQNKQALSRTIADWAAAPDTNARAALGSLCDLLRSKAGIEGADKNIVIQTDILGALNLQSTEDLLPCPTAFPEVGPVVPRDGLGDLAAMVPHLSKPLLVHADGGIGKTVFLQSLATALSADHEIELFDCFGGGAYRSPEDARHLPKRGMIHIVNRLACRGLCDPLLPLTNNAEDLVRAFRRRLEQVASTLQRVNKNKQLILFLDAIDNAAERARDVGEHSFPKLLLESLWHTGAIPGIKLVVSCRGHRRDLAKGDVPCDEFELKPFNEIETDRYLSDRVSHLTDSQVAVAYSRSQGNARILEYLVHSDRALLAPSETTSLIRLDDLLQTRIDNALEAARRRGYADSDLKPFLAGLSILPAPVPLGDYANAHGIEQGVVNSFAADLVPLLELTPHGLMFRDEPTETLIRRSYAVDDATLRLLANNLLAKQDSSVYAAAALPALLQRLGDGDLLFKLAFDDRFPSSITSKVGKEQIRYARVKAAARHAARHRDFDRLVHFLVELSSIAVANERGTDYILGHPDLVVASRDVDATRRLFETRTNWPGTRHARLSIASVLSGDLNDGLRYARNANEWINHFYRQNDEYRRDKSGPGRLDAAAIAFCLAARDRTRDAAQYVAGWTDWFAFGVVPRTLALLAQAEGSGVIPSDRTTKFLRALSGTAPLTGALAYLHLDEPARLRLLRRLATASKGQKPIETSDNFHRESAYGFKEGLLKAAALAVSLRHYADSRHILSIVPDSRPQLWSLRERFINNEAVAFVLGTTLRCVSERWNVTDDMLLPRELAVLGVDRATRLSSEEYRKALAEALKPQPKDKESADNAGMSYETRQVAEDFINRRLEPLSQLTQALAALFSKAAGDADAAFLDLIALWQTVRVRGENYYSGSQRNMFFDALGRQCIQFVLWVRDDLSVASVEAFANVVSTEMSTPVTALIDLTSMLSKRSSLHELAGQVAKAAAASIAHEDEVVGRGELLAKLGRAILPASVDEASTYFRTGLEQMDAIGSGDYQFVNELLSFSETLRGDELDEADFQTLSNICELNIADSEKFPWAMFGQALARVSGTRSLARLGRWADRGKVSLDYTLLPYLKALIEQEKMSPAIALGLLRLSIPVELYQCGTEQLADVLASRSLSNSQDVITELIQQFVESHPPIFMPATLAHLEPIARAHLGEDSALTEYLQRAAPRFNVLREEENDTRNYTSFHPDLNTDHAKRRQQNETEVARIAQSTDPISEESMAAAVLAVSQLGWGNDFRRSLMEQMRSRVHFGDRAKYVQVVASVDGLDIYTRINELKVCKDAWAKSSTGLAAAFRDAGLQLIRMNAEDFVDFGYLSRYRLNELIDISGLTLAKLALEIIANFTGSDAEFSPSIWFGLATVASDNTDGTPGRKALSRLLNSKAAQLSSTVSDGAWRPGLYPSKDPLDAATGLVWLKLGSSLASERWLAAHSIRVFADLSEWSVIDGLFRRYDSVDAKPFAAPELHFYFWHARLWLLIAIARIAIDHPKEVARHAEKLTVIATSEETSHILVRHFAAQAVLVCADGGSLKLSASDKKRLKHVATSPFRPIKEKRSYDNSFYGSRPDTMPKRKDEFHLEYDFEKYEVSQLSETFRQSRWQLKDDITDWVRELDPTARGMYEDDGRERPYRFRNTYHGDQYHSYGYQLGWHALYSIAGRYVRKHPVVWEPYDDADPWHEWLSRKLLTRSDGLWLSDGVDLPPVDAQVNLTERGEPSRAITGSSEKLLALLKTDAPELSGIVVAGDWSSNDDISITISSAFAPRNDAERLAKELAQEDPFQAWLPDAEDDDGASFHVNRDNRGFEPWILWGRGETKLDETDPLGVSDANQRHSLSGEIAKQFGLSSHDPFRRNWMDETGKIVVLSEAWRRGTRHDDSGDAGSRRLALSPKLLRDVLAAKNRELVFLIRLRRYTESSRSSGSEYWHTLATVRLDKGMKFHLYPGVINQLYAPRHT
jgi:hypothetical protein